MKKIKFILLGLLIIGNLSCSSDDDSVESFDIVGTWTITEGYIEPGTMELDMGGVDLPVEYSGSFVNIDDENRLNFNEDKTFTSIVNNIALEMELVVMGTSQTETFEMNNSFGEGTWELNGSELKINNDNGTSIKYHIDELNGDTLVMSSNVKDMVPDGGSNPMLESMDIDIKITLKRI
ncbi:lipocalin family protein [Aequorivita marina]|uniref:lipocalin family protein n=1 Tax=Aequorivita marina TaxID=3073654 RepID=UPI00287BBB10|nr:lipocalin family protein [Aequorivita sp. S2608]